MWPERALDPAPAEWFGNFSLYLKWITRYTVDHFNYCDRELYAEGVSLQEMAQSVGTPFYVYSRATIERHWHAFDQAFGRHPHQICYAVKANSNLAILQLLARLGSGFDIVSGGELARVLRAGGDANKIIFSGVGKSSEEIAFALETGIHALNIESLSELKRVAQIATESGKVASVSFRVNPDVDARTHPHIATGLEENKFGVPFTQALELYRQAAELPAVKITGIACHIGSQITQLEPHIDALERLLFLVRALEAEGIKIDELDLGGGLGIRYLDETPPLPAQWAAALVERLKQFGEHLKLAVEPGRAITGNAGLLVTKVEYLKPGSPKNFAIVDASMAELLRPMLYDADHDIIPVIKQPEIAPQQWDVVGPVCESTDTLGRSRELSLAEGDLLAIRSAGAYGAVLGSNYNSRLMIPEILVDGDRFHTIRHRQTLDQLLAPESLLPE